MHLQKVSNLPIKERVRLYNKAMTLRNLEGLGWRRATRRLGIKGSAVWNWYNNNRNPLRRYNTFNTTPSAKLSYILGAILGDGCVREREIIFAVADKEFCQTVFSHILAIQETGKNPSIKRHRVGFALCINSKSLATFIRKWENVQKVATAFPSAFIKGFVDAEGNISEKRIRIFNTNRNLLLFVKTLLARVGICSRLKLWKRNYGQPLYFLTISRKENLVRYYENIGFSIVRKIQYLEKAVEDYKPCEHGDTAIVETFHGDRHRCLICGRYVNENIGRYIKK